MPLLSQAADAVDNNVVVVGAVEVPFLLEKNGNGAFYDLIKMVEQESGLVFDIRIGPGERVRKWFYQGKVDVFTPAISSSLSAAHLASKPYFSKNILAFTTKPPVPSQLEDLHYKTVGYTRGYSYKAGLLTQPNVYYQSISTDKQNLLMLLSERIDVFLGEEISVFKTIEKLKLAKEAKNTQFYYSEKPISTEPVYFAFQSNAHGAYLKEKYESALESLRQQGKLKPPLF